MSNMSYQSCILDNGSGCISTHYRKRDQIEVESHVDTMGCPNQKK